MKTNFLLSWRPRWCAVKFPFRTVYSLVYNVFIPNSNNHNIDSYEKQINNFYFFRLKCKCFFIGITTDADKHSFFSNMTYKCQTSTFSLFFFFAKKGKKITQFPTIEVKFTMKYLSDVYTEFNSKWNNYDTHIMSLFNKLHIMFKCLFIIWTFY